MPQPALTAEEMLNWLETTSTNWRALIEAHPETLALPCDIARASTVGQLLQHVVVVELRNAERLAGLPMTEYEAVAYDSSNAIYSTHNRAHALYRKLLDSEIDWNEKLEYTMRSTGPAKSSRKTLLFHALLHSIRHYAQLATLVRQHGIKPDWQMDYLFMDVERA